MFSALELTLILLVAAVLGVVAFRMLHLPPMLGYLTVGILIGPHALGLASNSATTHLLAEFGVVFLMFSIGLEFSLPKLLSMRKAVFGLGMAQVVLTTGVAMLCGWLMAGLLPQTFDIGWGASFALGGALTDPSASDSPSRWRSVANIRHCCAQGGPRFIFAAVSRSSFITTLVSHRGAASFARVIHA
jgi:CPA2 family monovalent cation:H+ antiporter-2